MLMFPRPLPDEILCSLMARFCRINGVSDFRDIAAYLFGDGCYASFVDAEIDFQLLYRRSQFGFHSAESMLRQMTWTGGQSAIGEITEKDFLSVASGSRYLSLSYLTFWKAAVLSYCPTCREEDVRQFGMSYWHRTHQLPITFYCPEHGERLVKVPIKRCQLHTAFPCPNDLESNQFKADDLAGLRESFWQEVAVMAHRLFLVDNLPRCDLMQEVLLDELRVRKLVPQVSRRSKSGAIYSSLLPQLLEDSTVDAPPETLAYIRTIARGVDAPQLGVILGNVVLYFWLFGGWSAVEEKCHWLSVFGAAQPSASPLVGDICGQYRKACLTYLREHPGCSRLEFCRADYRAFRWLLHNDKGWLASHLPIPDRVGRQRVLF